MKLDFLITKRQFPNLQQLTPKGEGVAFVCVTIATKAIKMASLNSGRLFTSHIYSCNAWSKLIGEKTIMASTLPPIHINQVICFFIVPRLYSYRMLSLGNNWNKSVCQILLFAESCEEQSFFKAWQSSCLSGLRSVLRTGNLFTSIHTSNVLATVV